MRTILFLLLLTAADNTFRAWNAIDFSEDGYTLHFYRDKTMDNNKLFKGYSFVTTNKEAMNQLKNYFARAPFKHNYQTSTFMRFVIYKNGEMVKMHKAYISNSTFYIEDEGNWYLFSSANKVIRLVNTFDKIFYEWENLNQAPAFDELKLP